MRVEHWRVRVSVVAIVVGFSLGVASQQPPQPTFRTGADYVRVDVYPTIDGAPVDDLTRADFAVLEDGVLQQIDAFEHVHPATRRSGTPSREPSTVAESKEALADGRARVYLLYLDTPHVTTDGSTNIRRALAESLERLIGPDDLIAVLTPQMSTRDITFTRRPQSLERFLNEQPFWGQRQRVGVDETEQQYQACYPGYGPTPACKDDDRGIADEMIARRREQMTLDSLADAVRMLGDAREERKGVLLISEGWRLFGPNAALSRQLQCRVPERGIAVDPRTGRLTPTADNGLSGNNRPSCEGDRMALADLNDQLAFTRLTQLANRANVTFYAIDPRGLATFDTPIDQQRTGQPAPGQPILPPPSQDSAMLVRRQGTLRDLANSTDGIAVLNTNALDAAFRRIEADMSSYYLLAYHSTGKLDGKFHKIDVRIARARVQVRARPGFLAVPPPAAVPTSNVARPAGAALATDALKELAVIGRTPAVHLRGAIVGGALWIDAELPVRPFAAGTEIQLQVLDGKGEAVGLARRQLAAGARSFRHMIPISAAAGTLSVRARVVSAGGAALLETLDIDTAVASKTALTTRRTGAGAAAIDSPAADLRFRRSEQIRVELPATGVPFTAQLLDRTGRELPIPLTIQERSDEDGRRWASAGLPLAPLAQGDYVVQMAETGSMPVAVAFRVVP